jgi:hypothetical protein
MSVRRAVLEEALRHLEARRGDTDTQYYGESEGSAFIEGYGQPVEDLRSYIEKEAY